MSNLNPELIQSVMPPSRPYQEEMYRASLTRNIIIAMPTGSGKTHVAALRLKKEAEREPKKVSWFIAPTVSLCEQQRRVIHGYLGLPVGLISGALQPDQWKDKKLWKDALDTHRIIISTPQVLLDALRHGYVCLGSDIGLLVFDEAHHADKKHPYNMIMKEFYFDKKLESRDFKSFEPSKDGLRPFILGLTASPMFGGSVDKAFEKLEGNLDSAIIAPYESKSELASHVHVPTVKYIHFPPLINNPSPLLISANFASLARVYEGFNVEEDPAIRSLRSRLASVTDITDRNRIDLKLSEALAEKSTFVHKGLRDFIRTAGELCYDLGPWGADWYVDAVIKKALLRGAQSLKELLPNSKPEETEYFAKLLSKVHPQITSYSPEVVAAGCSAKTNKFIDALLEEHRSWSSDQTRFSGIVFATRRDCAIALTTILSHHPRTKTLFNVGTLLGNSESNKRNSFIDISRSMLAQKNDALLRDFRNGDKNLVIATSVGEEGLDIPNCGTVIRWDPPSNVVSWLQSRGRARHRESHFVLMIEAESATAKQISDWIFKENEMKRRYEEAHLRPKLDGENARRGMEPDLMFTHPQSGARMTSQAVLSHIAHFCSRLPSLTRTDIQPIYDLDPPDYPIGYHAIMSKNAPRPLNPGPFSATLTLPRLLPIELRIFRSSTLHESKKDARKDAAFVAYKALFGAGLLNENLLCSAETSRSLSESLRGSRGGTLSLPQSDPWQSSAKSAEGTPDWYENSLEVVGTGTCRFFTRKSLSRMGSLSFSLNDPRRHTKRTVVVTSQSPTQLTSGCLRETQLFTRRLFSVFHSKHLHPDNLDFSYLFSSSDNPLSLLWAERRAWAEAHRTVDGQSDTSGPLTANLAHFGAQFNYPSDLGVLVDGWVYHEFEAWRTEPLSEEEEKRLRKHYHYIPNLVISYPVVVAKPIKHRVNFLIPLPDTISTQPDPIILIPSHAKVVLECKRDTDFALAFPSILRAVSIGMTAMSLQIDILDREPSLKTLPNHLIQAALTSPNADSLSNYERLESLGDAVLKLVSTVQLLATYPCWPAGYIVNQRQQVVCNAALSQVAMKNRLYQWIIRTPFIAKLWAPTYRQSPDEGRQESEQGATLFSDDADAGSVLTDAERKDCHVPQQVGGSGLSKKILADVVEALIGAAYLSGDFTTSIDCMNVLSIDGSGPWKPLSHNISEIFTRCKPTTLPMLDNAEKIIGYNFRNRGLLLEALMDANNLSDVESMSYERLQLVGEALLEMLVIDTLYRTEGRRFSPAEMHSRKITVVNCHYLAFVCLRAHIMVDTSMPYYNTLRRSISPSTQSQRFDLSNCLTHSTSSFLDEQRRVSQRFEEAEAKIVDDLRHSDSYPWAALANICAPKRYSDIVASIIGAVYLDCAGRIDIVKDVLTKFGILELLDRLRTEDVELMHPVNRVMEWAGRHQMLGSLRFVSNVQNEKKICSLELHGRPIATVTKGGDYGDDMGEDTLRLLVACEALPILLKDNQ